jgi:hypothetical protein
MANAAELQILASVRLFDMRLVSIRQEAHYRGYRIEGVKQGEGILLGVTPARPDLPVLKYSRFRTLRSTWVKAVGVVVKYVDEAFLEAAHVSPPKVRGGGFVTLRSYELTDRAQLDEITRLRTDEDNWRRAGPSAPKLAQAETNKSDIKVIQHLALENRPLRVRS